MKKYPFLIAISIILINCIIVYFGRIYYPENFVNTVSTSHVSFLENLLVITMGEVFITIIIGFFTIMIFLLINDFKTNFRK